MSISDKQLAADDSDLLFDILHLWTAFTSETNGVTQPLQRELQLLEISRGMDTDPSGFRIRLANYRFGVALCLTNRFDEALEHFKISIRSQGRLPRSSGDLDIEPKVDMALAHWRLGDLARAEEILQGTVYTWEARYGNMYGYFPGRILHALGNVRYDQGRFDESKELHERALQQYQNTFGRVHHKRADLYHKVAQHCILRAEYGRARMLIDQGLGIWQREERFHRPELARTTFLKAILAEKCGNKEEAARLTKTAREIRNKVPHATVKTDEEPLTEGDFDEIVAFFAR